MRSIDNESGGNLCLDDETMVSLSEFGGMKVCEENKNSTFWKLSSGRCFVFEFAQGEALVKIVKAVSVLMVKHGRFLVQN